MYPSVGGKAISTCDSRRCKVSVPRASVYISADAQSGSDPVRGYFLKEMSEEIQSVSLIRRSDISAKEAANSHDLK